MNAPATSSRRRAVRGVPGLVRALLVAGGLAAAIGLQLAGGHLQSQVASRGGAARPSAEPSAMTVPAAAPRGFKVAQVVAIAAPVAAPAPWCASGTAAGRTAT